MGDILKQVRAVLSISPARWFSITEAIPVELLVRIPAPKEWSALGCLQHIVDIDRGVFPDWLRAFLTGLDLPVCKPDSRGRIRERKQSPKALALEFSNLRKINLGLLEKLTTEDLSHTAQHSELGKVTLEEMLCEWAGHDLMHLVQAERAILQFFIPGTGPWRRYFSDYEIEPGSRLEK
jgi:hypothetical protein